MRIITAACLLSVVVCAAPAAAQQLALAPGDKAPKLMGWTLDGQLKGIEYEGITLVNFWTTWCEPCRQEMPALEELSQLFAGQGLRVVGFNREPEATIEQVSEYVSQMGITYDVLRPDRRWNWGGVPTVPTSFLVDGEGIILRRYVGARPEQVEGLKRDITDAVNGRPLQPMVLPTDSGGKTTTF